MFPLILSWVSTIYRGQCFPIDTLHDYIDETVFADGQVYTAISRVRKLEYLHIKKLHPDAFKTSSTVRDIMSMAREHNVLRSVPVHSHSVHTSATWSRETGTTQLGHFKNDSSSSDKTNIHNFKTMHLYLLR